MISATGVLVDSDVLIWYARGHSRAVEAVNNLPVWQISAVTYMELVQGCCNKAELKGIRQAFNAGESDVLPITQSISSAASALVEKYALSHSLFLADALIAATALEHGLPLFTANRKHFLAVEGLKLQLFKP
jgi:predicted nucleic acid-binding protein